MPRVRTRSPFCSPALAAELPLAAWATTKVSRGHTRKKMPSTESWAVPFSSVESTLAAVGVMYRVKT